MKIMKKILKSRILLVVVTVILTGSISVYAVGRYYATQVDYEPSNSNFNIDNMSDALDQLHITQNTTISDLQTQLNGISTTDCIRGTMDLSSQCKTSSGCLVEI